MGRLSVANPQLLCLKSVDNLDSLSLYTSTSPPLGRWAVESPNGSKYFQKNLDFKKLFFVFQILRTFKGVLKLE